MRFVTVRHEKFFKKNTYFQSRALKSAAQVSHRCPTFKSGIPVGCLPRALKTDHVLSHKVSLSDFMQASKPIMISVLRGKLPKTVV